MLPRRSFYEIAQRTLLALAPLAFSAIASIVTQNWVFVSWSHVAMAFIVGFFIHRMMTPKPTSARGELARRRVTCAVISAIAALASGLNAIGTRAAFASWLIEMGCIITAFLSTRRPSAPQPDGKNKSDKSGSSGPETFDLPALVVYANVLLFRLYIRTFGSTQGILVYTLLALAIPSLAICLFVVAEIKQPHSNPSVARPPLQSTSGIVGPGLDKLSPRERDVVAYTLSGMTSAECSESLGLKPSTVREYLRRAYSKLGLANVQELKSRYSLESTGDQGTGQNRARILKALTDALPRIALVLLFSPTGLSSGIWAAGGNDLLAISIGFMLGPEIAFAIRPHTSEQSGNASLAAISITSLVLLILSAHSNASTMLVWARICTRLLLAMALCFHYGADVRQRSHPDTNCSETSFSISALILGIAIEELWRGSFWFSFMPAALLFVIPVIGTALVAGLKSRPQEQQRRMVPAALTILACVIISRDIFMATITLCVGLTALTINHIDDLDLASLADPSIPFLLGIGVVAGIYGVNVFSWLFTYANDALGMFGTQSGLEVASIALSSSIFLGSGLLTSRELSHRARNQSHREMTLNESTAIEYLLGLGLPEIQAAVSVDIARGMTTNEISEHLNYSPITVRAARRGAFEKLNVRTASELQSKIHAGICRSQENDK